MKKILLSLAFAAFGLTSGYAQTIMSQNFTGATAPAMPTGWTNATTTTSTATGTGWVTTTAATDLYFGTVPNTAPHTEYAVVNEYATPGNNPATMTSPSFSLVGAAAPYLSYDFIYFEAYLAGPPVQQEQAWVSLSTDGGTTWNVIDSETALASATWTTHYISLATYAGSANCKLRFGYKDNGGDIIGVAVGNINVFNAQANDIALTAVTPVAGAPNDYFTTTGGSATFAGTMLNETPNTITSFSASYQVGASAPVSQTFSGLSVAPFTTYNFTMTTPYAVTTLGNQAVKMWVTETGDPALTNDSMNTAVNGVAFMPTKRLMFEEATGSWCGYCVRGIVFMDSLWDIHSNQVSIVAVHDYNGYDPMAEENTATQHYDTYISSQIGGYPSIVIDRSVVDDPSGAIDDYNAMSGNFGYADMTMTATFSSTTGVTVSGTVKPALDMTGDYRVELVLTEDKVHGTTSGWSQHNYYAVDVNNQALSGAGFNFQDSTSGGVVTGDAPMYLYYKFVDRYTVPDVSTSPNGVAGSLPATMTAGTSYPFSFSAVTSTGTQAWNYNNMRATVMLIDNTPGSQTLGQVLNSINVTNPALGVANVAAGIDEVRVFPNPTKDLAHVQFVLKNAGKVSVNVFDMLGRAVFSTPSEDMTVGGQQVNFSTAEFASGNYSVSITTETGVVTQQLSVIK